MRRVRYDFSLTHQNTSSMDGALPYGITHPTGQGEVVPVIIKAAQ